MIYRGIGVAVKTFDSDSSIESIICEASFLSKLNHPNLPLFFGYNTIERPYFIARQFYGIDGKAVTMHKELASPNYIGTCEQWIILCGQLMEAVKYLHSVAHCLHNDVKSDNILFANSHVANEKYSVVLIHFNKATRTSDRKKYTLSAEEKTLYQSTFGTRNY